MHEAKRNAGVFDANRAFWNSSSDAYQHDHADTLLRQPLAWGVWRIPEAQLRVLGDLAGRSVLELGCGAAQWTCALRLDGVRATGVDLSERQLAHARVHAQRVGAAAPLVQGHAERLPFRSGSFDVVFCDHGATSFAAPGPTVAEAARVLRPGGLFAFCMSTPLRDICADPATYEVTPHLAIDYFGLEALDDGVSVSAQLPYGAWIRLFRRHALVVEDLVELQAPPGAATSYADYVPAGWAARWPAEHIWKVRKPDRRT
jgi:SAM-dependent methyltransferase